MKILIIAIIMALAAAFPAAMATSPPADGQSIPSSGTITYSAGTVPAAANASTVLGSLEQAMNAWAESNSGLKFAESDAADIRLAWHAQGTAGWDGQTACTEDDCTVYVATGGTGCDEKYRTINQGLLTNQIMHEIGHAFGLGHTSEKGHLMYSDASRITSYNDFGISIPESIPSSANVTVYDKETAETEQARLAEIKIKLEQYRNGTVSKKIEVKKMWEEYDPYTKYSLGRSEYGYAINLRNEARSLEDEIVERRYQLNSDVREYNARVKAFEERGGVQCTDAGLVKTGSPESLQKINRTADEAIYEEELARHYSILEMDPGNVTILEQAVGILYDLERYEEAIKYYDEILIIGPDASEKFMNKGNALYELEKYEDAIRYYDKALTLEPDSTVIFNSKADALRQLEKYKEAIKIYDKSIGIEPGTWAHNNKGVALYELDMFEEAIEEFDRAIGIDSNDTVALSWKGYALVRLDMHGEAVPYFDRALELDPDSAGANRWKGITLHWFEDLEGALAQYEKALKSQEWVWTLYEKGWVLYDLERYDESVKTYERMLEKDPDNVRGLVRIAISLYELERYAEAEECLYEAQSHDLYNKRVKYWLGEVSKAEIENKPDQDLKPDWPCKSL